MAAGSQNGSGAASALADVHEGEQGLGGELNAHIARAIVRIYREVCGRGPTRARASYRGNVVVVVLEQVLTQAERSLVASDRCNEALALRRELHDTMRDELARAVSELTGCRVRAVMGDAQFDPDVAAEVFVLDQAVNINRFSARAV
jgi:uncharacterized protein YbcI